MTCPHCGNEDDEKITCAARTEEVPFAYTKTDLEGNKTREESSVRVVLPVFTCGICVASWLDQTGSVVRDAMADKARQKEEKVVKDCPCCGRVQSTEEWVLEDALHPSETWYTVDPDPEMHGSFRFHGHQDRPGDAKPVWKYHCNESAGGCGLVIHGYSAQDCIDKWNKRP